MPYGRSEGAASVIGTYTLISPQPRLILSQLVAALQLPERHSFPVEPTPLALRRDPRRRTRVQPLDLLPPDVGIDLHRDSR